MRSLLWMIVLIGGYVWVVTSGHEGFILEKGKLVYDMVVDWFEDAEIDFQTGN